MLADVRGNSVGSNLTCSRPRVRFPASARFFSCGHCPRKCIQCTLVVTFPPPSTPPHPVIVCTGTGVPQRGPEYTLRVEIRAVGPTCCPSLLARHTGHPRHRPDMVTVTIVLCGTRQRHPMSSNRVERSRRVDYVGRNRRMVAVARPSDNHHSNRRRTQGTNRGPLHSHDGIRLPCMAHATA